VVNSNLLVDLIVKLCLELCWHMPQAYIVGEEIRFSAFLVLRTSVNYSVISVR